MELHPDDKRELEALLKSRWWQVACMIRDNQIMDYTKKVMQDPKFDTTSEEAKNLMKEVSEFGKEHKRYEDILRSHTLFTHTPNLKWD